MKTPLIILSFDGLDTKDMAYLKNKPGFKRFLAEASGSDQVKSVYPSVTYAAHASIITGCWPKRHGIVDNTKVQINRLDSPDWYWYQKDIQVPTLYDLAKENDYTVAALLWPTTGRSKIDFNMPEIFNNRKWTSQMMVSLYAGSPAFQIKMVKRHDHLRDGKKQPALDHFTTATCLDTIKDHRPDMLLVHLTDLDSIRHKHGHDSQEAKEALDRHDHRLTQMLDALAADEKYNHALLVILGDHSSIDVTMCFSLNAKLIEWGYLRGTIEGFSHVKAISKSCDGSCYLYVEDESIQADLVNQLDALQKEHETSFKVLYQPDIQNLGADPKAFAMLEAQPPYHFVDDVLSPWCLPIDKIPYYKGSSLTAVHGFNPNRPDYDTCFYIKGPGIMPHIDLGNMNLIDIAPTIAQLMAWDLDNVDGKSLHGLLTREVLHETDKT